MLSDVIYDGWFKNKAAASAKTYYNYARTMKKSRSVLSPLSIQKIGYGFYEFHLNQKMFLSDSCFLCIEHPGMSPYWFEDENKQNLNYVSNMLYSITKYSDDFTVVTIEIKSPLLDIFDDIALYSITFVSDLSFLIKNVEQWYMKYGHLINIPPDPIITESDYFFRGCESEQQKSAVKMALTHNISYVWGAPGTGKTQIVLTDCVLSYMRKKLPVLILAPTNNAIEQTLRSIITAIKEQNLSINSLYRLGTASNAFASEYAEICDRSDRQKKIENLKNEIATLTEMQNKQYFAMNKLKRCDEFFLVFADYQSLYEQMQKMNAETESLKKDINAVESEIQQLDNEISEYQSQINQIDNYMSSFGYKFKKVFNHTDSNELIQQKNHLMDSIKQTENKIFELSTYLEIPKRKLKEMYKDYQNPKLILENKLSEIKQLSIFEFNTFCDTNTSNDLFCKLHERFRDYPFDSELDDRIIEKTDLLKAVSDDSKKMIVNKNVFCCTVDYFYSHFQSLADVGLHFSAVSHIFLDEAAYCPMIKAGIMFSLNRPVTFFGDHMQLPPICEASEEAVRNEDTLLFLWSLSALYFSQIFNAGANIHTLFNSYADLSEPSHENLTVAALPNTYRFGNNLAAILDKHVYHNGFIGTDSDTEIISCNAVRSPLDQSLKENHNEAIAIRNFIFEKKLTNYAVLTPYRDQRKLLIATLRGIASPDNILTIHGSQGREWDTVIISAVESGKPFLTNSRIPKGLHVLNTAISRAKKTIVVVCNRSFWLEKSSEQLLSDLISASSAYPSSTI